MVIEQFSDCGSKYLRHSISNFLMNFNLSILIF